MSPVLGFCLTLACTVLLLAGVVVSGKLGRLKLHLPLVGLTLASLALTIWYAEKLGELYDLEAAGAITPVHLAFAKIATAAYLAPLATGIATLRDRRYRAKHRLAAFSVLALTAITALTGTWMILAAPRLP
jgi:hypothetical protein